MHLGGKQVPKMSSMQTFLGIQMKRFMQNKTNQKIKNKKEEEEEEERSNVINFNEE